MMVSSHTLSPRTVIELASPPPAWTSGSWWWSPTRFTFAPAVRHVVMMWWRSTVPHIPASSTTTTVLALSGMIAPVAVESGNGERPDLGAGFEFAGCTGRRRDSDGRPAG